MMVDMFEDIIEIFLQNGWKPLKAVECDDKIDDKEIKIIIRDGIIRLYYKWYGLTLCIVMERSENDGIQTDKKTE